MSLFHISGFYSIIGHILFIGAYFSTPAYLIGQPADGAAAFSVIYEQGPPPIAIQCTAHLPADIDPEAVTITWEFEPGVYSTGHKSSHLYLQGGKRPIKMHITYASGETQTLIKQVDLIGPEENPITPFVLSLLPDERLGDYLGHPTLLPRRGILCQEVSSSPKPRAM